MTNFRGIEGSVFLCMVLGLAMLSFPGAVRAEKVGVLMPTGNIPYYMTAQKALEAELVNQGVSAEFLLQRPSPTGMSWKNATRKLITLEAGVIVTYGSATALAAMSETNDLAIVYTAAFEPEAVGATGKNLTGCNASVPIGTLLNSLKKIANPAKIGVLYSSDEVDSLKQAEAVIAQAVAAGMEAAKVDVKNTPDGIELPSAPAVVLTCSGAIQQQKSLESIIAKARADKVITASLLGGGEQGVVITLAANPEQQGRDAARMVAGVLKGAAASSLPVNTSPKVELVLNLTEARTIGCTIPFEILSSAKVIK